MRQVTAFIGRRSQSIVVVLLCILAIGCSGRATPQQRTPIEEAGLLAGKGPGEVPAETIASVERTTSDGSTVKFTYITFVDEGERCRYVVATSAEGGTIGATGSCGHATDSFSDSWTVGTITVGRSTFAIAFGTDYGSSGIDRVEVELPGASGASPSAPVEDDNWLVVVPAPSDTSAITELRGLSNGREVESVDTRPPHMQGG